MDTLSRTNSDLSLSNKNFKASDIMRSGLYIFLILYSGLAKPNLPSSLKPLFNSNLFKILIFFLIVYLAQKENDIMMSLLVAIAFFITMTLLTESTITEKFKEKFINYDRSKNENENE
jgi:hypothetical protein